MLQVPETWAHDERLQSTIQHSQMMYEELRDHFDQAEVVKKDREAIHAKKKAQQDFSATTQ